MLQSIQDTFTLKNGVRIPCVGFGTYLIPDGDAALRVVSEAISLGYRHIDTAAFYKNEVSVGRAVRECGLDRRELFVTSKVWNTDRGYDKTLAAFQRTLDNLGLEFLDLYLIHWPANKKQFADCDRINAETWRALEELYLAGRIRAIGVSNFLRHHLETLQKTARIQPMVNQLQFHPSYMQAETTQYCQENGIQVEAWSPLGRSRMLAHPVLLELAAKYGASAAQICLRWALQHGVLPLPKSTSSERIAENTRIFNFEISPEDLARVDALPFALEKAPSHPDEIDF